MGSDNVLRIDRKAEDFFDALFDLNGVRKEDIEGKIRVLARETGHPHITHADNPQEKLTVLKLDYLSDIDYKPSG